MTQERITDPDALASVLDDIARYLVDPGAHPGRSVVIPVVGQRSYFRIEVTIK